MGISQVTNEGYKNVVGMLFWDVSKMLKCPHVVIGTLFKGYKKVSYNILQMLFLPQNNIIRTFIFNILIFTGGSRGLMVRESDS